MATDNNKLREALEAINCINTGGLKRRAQMPYKEEEAQSEDNYSI